MFQPALSLSWLYVTSTSFVVRYLLSERRGDLAMLKQAGTQCGDEYRYAEPLVQDRRRELKVLELKHRHQEISRDEYLSCRRALLQAISELETLTRAEQQLDAAQQESHDESYRPIPTIPEPI